MAKSIEESARDLLGKLGGMTTEEFSQGAEMEERNALRDALLRAHWRRDILREVASEPCRKATGRAIPCTDFPVDGARQWCAPCRARFALEEPT